MCYRGEHEVALGPGVYGLVARREDDPRRSNWAGKSAFLEAIKWALYGGQRLGSQNLDELISHGEMEAAVELELSDGTFISRRRVRGKPARDLYVQLFGRDEQAGDGAEEAIRLEVVGADEDQLASTCWAEQGEVGRLAKMRAGALTELVEAWVGLDRLVDAWEHATGEFQQAAKHVEACERDLAGVVARAGNPDELEAIEKEIIRWELELREYEARAKGYPEAYEAWRRRKVLQDLEEEKLQAEEDIAKQRQRLEALPLPDPNGPSRFDVEADRAFLQRAENEQLRLKRLAQGEFDGHCPVSPGFECPARKEIQGRREENRAAYEEAKRTAEGLAAAYYDKIRRYQRGEERHAARELVEQRLERLRDALGTIEEKLAKWDGAEAGDPPQHPGAFDTRKLEALREKREDMVRCRDTLVPECQRRLEDARRELEVSRAAAKVLGPEGARRKAAEGAVDVITQGACRVLAESGVDLSVEARWGREVGKLESQCRECGRPYPAGRAVKRCECGAERQAAVKHEFSWVPSARSGAALDLAGLALRCGAHELRHVEGRLSLALLDEPLAQCDAANVELVSRHLARMVGGAFEQAIVADHHTGFMDALPRRIVVVGSGRWSRIEVVG